MDFIDDSSLLNEFVRTRSERAFAQLVERHIHLVYAAARRQVRDAHLADDVTQAVFTTLAHKAWSVRGGRVLPAWLLSTTRYTAANALTRESRRRHYERQAANMAQTAHHDPEPTDTQADDQLAEHLDAAMERLNSKDRSAVAMRFLQGKSIREVGDVMGISEEAAQKRLGRAVDKLRDFFQRRGITTASAAALAQGLSRQLANAAPAAMAPAVAATALSSSATVGGAGILGAIGKFFGLGSSKIAASACVVAVVVAGAVVVESRRTDSPARVNAAPAPTTAPAAIAPRFAMWDPFVPDTSAPISVSSFKNIVLMPIGEASAEYEAGIDLAAKRTPESDPAGVLRSIVPNPAARSVITRGAKAIVGPYRGKRVRVSALLKTENVETSSGLILIIMGEGNRVIANDDMGGRPVLGTTDWKKYDIVADVPENASLIMLGTSLRGKGTLWADNLELAVVEKTVPITDDRRWHMWSFTPNVYKAELDKNELRNGKPTVCLSSTGPTPAGSWAAYDHNDRERTDWNGKRIRMTGWMKCEGVTNPSGLAMRALGPAFVTLARDNTFPKRPLRGSLGWMKYSVYLDVPADAQGVCSGIVMNGGGKIWLDDVKYEVVEPK